MHNNLKSGKQNDSLVKQRSKVVADVYMDEPDIVNDLFHLSNEKYGSMRDTTDPFHHMFINRSEDTFRKMFEPKTYNDVETEIPEGDLKRRHKFEHAYHFNSKKVDSGPGSGGPKEGMRQIGTKRQVYPAADHFTQVRGHFRVPEKTTGDESDDE
jgi:hypothetical protein